jgi:hypothetical protein
MSHNNFFELWHGRNFFIRNLCPLWSEFCTRNRPSAVSQLAEMTHPNRPFISASEGQQVLISIAAASARIG